MAAWLDGVKFNPTLGGTTDFVVSSNVIGFLTPAGANAVNGRVYKWHAESADLSQWEDFEGAYTVGTTTAARATVLYNSSGTGTLQSGAGTKINFTTVPTVSCVALKEDMIAIEEANSFTATQQAQARANIGVMGRNRIINGGFLINQRSYVSGAALAAGVYAHDRWKAGAAGCTYTFTQSGNPFTTITITANSLQQVIEGANIEGGTYTLSWAGTAQGKINGGAAASSPLTIAGLTAGSNVTVEFGTGTLGAVQFEAASVASPFEFRPIKVELGLCQRYYETGNFILLMGSSSTNQAEGGWVAFKATKRAIPTITQTNVSNNGAFNATPSNTNAAADGFMSNRTTIATINSTYTETWTASAEL